MEKLVSIILPTCNGASTIKASITSVLGQSYKNWELLVIDDGSTDDTTEFIEEIVKSDSRIRFERNEKNLGIQKTLNRGLHAAHGEYIARIDDDDIWFDIDKLQQQVDFLDTHPKCVLVGTGAVAVNEQGEEIFKHRNPVEDTQIRKIILAKNCFFHSSVLFRKETVMAVGGYSDFEEARHIEDYDLWLKLGIIGKIANLPTYSVQLTLRKNSLSSENKIMQFKRSIRTIKKYRDKYPGYFFAIISLLVRLVVYRFFQFKPLRSVYRFLYKIYKRV